MTVELVSPQASVNAGTLPAKVAANVRAESARLGLTQTYLATVLQTSQQGLSRRLKGRTPFTLNEIEILAALFSMPPGDLLDGTPGPGGMPDPDAAISIPRWAPSGSNRRPTDYKFAVLAEVA